jgi:hypothetical protein
MNPFFDVVKQDLMYGNRDHDLGLVKNRTALVNADNGELLGIMSKNYTIVTNKQVFDLFSSATATLKIKEPVHRLTYSGSAWKCDLVFDDERTNQLIIKDDIVGLALRIFNSYNGTIAFGYELFGFRHICSNGMIFGKKSLFSQTYRHFLGNPEKLYNDFSGKFLTTKMNVERWIHWTTLTFPFEIFKKFIENKTYLSKRTATDLIENYHVILKTFNDAETKWGSFNVLTYYLTHKIKTSKKGTDGVFRSAHYAVSNLIHDFYKLTD